MDAMTTVLEYLQRKYRNDKPTTMTKVEAEAFGIAYPLSSGWRGAFGGIKVTAQMLGIIDAATAKKSAEMADAIKRTKAPKTKRQKANDARRAAKALAKPAAPIAPPVRKSAAQGPSMRVEGVDVRSVEFLSTWAWRELRYATIKRFGAVCLCCGATPRKTGEPIQVDHIKPRSLFPHLAMDPENLQTLCGPCNQGKSNRDFTDWR
jgi:HNH endonuclease